MEEIDVSIEDEQSESEYIIEIEVIPEDEGEIVTEKEFAV